MQLITAVQAEERPAIGRRSACAPFHIDARKLTHFYGQAYTYSLTALIMNGFAREVLPCRIPKAEPLAGRGAAPHIP